MAKGSSGIKRRIESAEAALAGSLTAPMRAKEEDVQEFLTSATIQDAQALFMRFCPISKISEITNISAKTIKRYVEGIGGQPGWLEERKALSKEMNDLVKQSMLANLKKNTALGINLIERALQALSIKHEQEQTEPTLEEAFKVAKIFDILFKNRLAEEKSDPEGATAALTPTEVMDAFKSDPYFKYAFTKEAPSGDPEPPK